MAEQRKYTEKEVLSIAEAYGNLSQIYGAYSIAPPQIKEGIFAQEVKRKIDEIKNSIPEELRENLSTLKRLEKILAEEGDQSK